jgi:hypothetical protein
MFELPSPPEPINTWWDWNCWPRTEEWTIWAFHIHGIWILITLNPTWTKDPEEHNVVLKRQDTHCLSTFPYKLWSHCHLQNCLAAWTCIKVPFLHIALHRLKSQKLPPGTLACTWSEKDNLFPSPRLVLWTEESQTKPIANVHMMWFHQIAIIGNILLWFHLKNGSSENPGMTYVLTPTRPQTCTPKSVSQGLVLWLCHQMKGQGTKQNLEGSHKGCAHRPSCCRHSNLALTISKQTLSCHTGVTYICIGLITSVWSQCTIGFRTCLLLKVLLHNQKEE